MAGFVQAGVPSQQELIDASLDHHLNLSGGDLRKFLQDSVTQLELTGKPGITGLVSQLTQALEKAEEAHGSVIENEAALSAFQASVKVCPALPVKKASR